MLPCKKRSFYITVAASVIIYFLLSEYIPYIKLWGLIITIDVILLSFSVVLAVIVYVLNKDVGNLSLSLCIKLAIFSICLILYSPYNDYSVFWFIGALAIFIILNENQSIVKLSKKMSKNQINTEYFRYAIISFIGFFSMNILYAGVRILKILLFSLYQSNCLI